MKKPIGAIILTTVLCFFATAVFANSGPVFWKGYPSSDIMFVEEDSPITVENENLIFDFSDSGDSGYTITGKATARYKMINSTDKLQSVQMAFPFVGRLRELLPDDIIITADDNAVPYDIYIGDVVHSYGDPRQQEKEVSFDFKSIVNTITNGQYKARNFSKNEKGKLYTIEVEPTTDQRINFAVDSNFDLKTTIIFTDGFNRYERDGDKVRIAAWCYEPEILEIYVLGEDIDLNINAYTDGELKEGTDLFTYKISAKEVELAPYLLERMKNNPYRNKNDMISDNMISDVQLYNMYAKALDEYITQNMGYVSLYDLMDQDNYQRIITLVYTVEFPHSSEREVSISYYTSGTMDKTKTVDPLYTFDYILNPAKHWKDFKDLNIKVIAPEKAPHIVKSSIEFTKGENNTYTATLNKLPEDDLSFTLYATEKITLQDRIKGKLNNKFGYFFPFVANAAALLVIGVIVMVIMLKRKKNKCI